jgi:hypothetical protein
MQYRLHCIIVINYVVEIRGVVNVHLQHPFMLHRKSPSSSIGNFVSIEQRRSAWLSQAAPFLVLGKKVWYNNIIGIIRKDK